MAKAKQPTNSYLVSMHVIFSDRRPMAIDNIASANSELEAVNAMLDYYSKLSITVVRFNKIIDITPTPETDEQVAPVKKKKRRSKRGAYKARKPAKAPTASDGKEMRLADVAAYVKKKHGLTIKPSLGTYWVRHGSYGTKLKTIAKSKPTKTTPAYIDAFMAIKAKKSKK